MDLLFNSLSRELHDRFPELSQERYDALVGNIDVDGEPFLLYGIIFNHYLNEIATKEDESAKQRAAHLMEDMALSSDSHVAFLLKSELLPTVLSSQEILDFYWHLLGRETRRQLTIMPPRFSRNVDFRSG